MKNYFHFKQLNEDTFLITNDFGKYQFLPREAFARFATTTVIRIRGNRIIQKFFKLFLL